jgi:hypothetical protein
MCRFEVDRFIRLWEESGPGYFELAQLMRISAETYRAIAPSITDPPLDNGETTELNAENSRQIAAPAAEVRRTRPAANPRPKSRPPRSRPGSSKRTGATAARPWWAKFKELSRRERYGENWLQLTSVLMRHQSAIDALLLENGLK